MSAARRLSARVLGGLVAVAVLVGQPVPAAAVRGTRAKNLLEGIDIEQRVGTQLPLDARFKDETGRDVRLGDYFTGERPVVLALVYYECPMLCTLVLNGLVKAFRALRSLDFVPGRQFDVVVISFDPKETPRLAAAKKKTYLDAYGHPETAAAWHFLTGDQEAIDAVTAAVGFKYRYDPDKDQFAHAAGVMIASPSGKLSRYLLGIEYAPRDMRLALTEASENKVGSLAEQILLLCYHYDPETGKYTAATMTALRIAGALTVIGIVSLIVVLRRRERRRWTES
ncbi:MAG: SCO family protein [Candidatus Dadabacteria bacterium]|nr:MAG: SCO family protein [Candidatus Dadabacteria bacterium]